MTEAYELASLNADNGLWRAVLRYKGQPSSFINPDLTMLFPAEDEQAARRHIQEFWERRRQTIREELFS
jgi:hypothetical protein